MAYTKEQLWRMKHYAPDLYEASLTLWEECNKVGFPLDIKPSGLVQAMGDVSKALAKVEGGNSES